MKKMIISILVFCFLLTGSNSFAQIFISIDGVAGESNVPGFAGATQINSFSWGATNKSTFSGTTGGTSAGKVSLADINFMKPRGKSSAAIQMAVFNGKHFPKAEIRFYTAGTDLSKPTQYLTITLEDVFVTSWQLSGAGSEKPVESVSIIFARMRTEEMVGTNPDGTVKKNNTGWDITKNAAY